MMELVRMVDQLPLNGVEGLLARELEWPRPGATAQGWNESEICQKLMTQMC
jgi:hypothetical protein